MLDFLKSQCKGEKNPACAFFAPSQLLGLDSIAGQSNGSFDCTNYSTKIPTPFKKVAWTELYGSGALTG